MLDWVNATILTYEGLHKLAYGDPRVKVPASKLHHMRTVIQSQVAHVRVNTRIQAIEDPMRIKL